MFDRILWWLGIVAFIFMCITIILVLTGWSPAAPDLGDIFTFGSILVAAFTAYVGWNKSEEIRQAKNVKELEKSNREAKIEAVILYAQMPDLLRFAWGIWRKYADAIAKIETTKRDEPIQRDVEFHKSLRNSCSQLGALPHTSSNFTQAGVLLRNNFAIGGAYLAFVEQHETFKATFQRFINEPKESSVKQSEDQTLNALLHSTTDLLLTIDTLRQILANIPVPDEGIIAALHHRADIFEDAIGVATEISGGLTPKGRTPSYSLAITAIMDHRRLQFESKNE